MNRTCLIGYTGFVGSNLLAQQSFDDLYRSTNIADIRGKHYSLLVCAGIGAVKWRANKEPAEDRAAIDRLLDPLLTVNAERAVLISTVDVYPVATAVDEDFDCASLPSHPYGTNRLYAEQCLRQHFRDLSVVRLPGLFGPGLKKNVIFDLLHRNCLDAINPASAFQYYDTTSLASDLALILKAGIPLVNLATQPLETFRIRDAFFAGTQIGLSPAPEAHYDIRTRHANVFGKPGHYRFDAGETMARLGQYVASVRKEL
jgi:hypothetical protein